MKLSRRLMLVTVLFSFTVTGQSMYASEASAGAADGQLSLRCPRPANWKLRQDISNNYNGRLFSGRLGYRVPWSKKLRVNLNVNATYADDEYMEIYFMSDGGGVKDMGGGAMFMYLLDKDWSFITIANYTRLLNDAANSPLVENAGSKNQFWLGLGVAYRF